MWVIIVFGLLFGIRTETGKVVDNTSIVTCDGNLWNYETEIKSNESVRVVFGTNGTETIYDDPILWVSIIR